jgi:hypothetical protein
MIIKSKSYDPQAIEQLRLKLLAESEALGLTHASRYFENCADHFQQSAKLAAENDLPGRSPFVYTMQ